MKVSELILELVGLQQERGDVEVLVGLRDVYAPNHIELRKLHYALGVFEDSETPGHQEVHLIGRSNSIGK